MKIEDAARYIIKTIEGFDVKCGLADYTDTGEVWELLDFIRHTLQEALHETPKSEYGWTVHEITKPEP